VTTKKVQLVRYGKMLQEGEQWNRLNKSRISFNYPTKIGEAYGLFDSRRGVVFSGVLERADKSGAPGDVIEPGVEVRVVKGQTIDVAEAKQEKIRLVDARTDELINTGFTFEGEVCSLSTQAQLKIVGLLVGSGLASYPVVWNNIDDTGTVSLEDPSEVQAFYAAAMATVEGHLATGTDLKNQINACATVAEVDAVVDAR